MISPRFPYLLVIVRLEGRSLRDDAALVDTGFDGDVSIPASEAVGIQPAGRERLILATGREEYAFVFNGVVHLGDLGPVPARIHATGNQYVIGTGVLRLYEVILDHGQRVIVNP